MKLSACWIVKNEAKEIALSINSVKDAVDELIVVDTGSTDNTVETVEALGANVYHFEWINDFSAARNFTISKASGDYIIFMDADEYFVPPLGKNERESIINRFEQSGADAMHVFRQNIDMDTGAAITTDTCKRIFRNDPGLRYEKPIHEELYRDGVVSGSLPAFDLKLMHTGYSDTVIGEKIDRNVEILEAAAQTETDPYKNFHNMVYLMREYRTIDPDRAMYYWREVSDKSAYWDSYSNIYGAPFIEYYLTMITLALENRSYISRKYLYETVIKPLRKNYPYYIMTPALDVIFQFFFDRKNERFLKDFDSAMAKTTQNTNDYNIDHYKSFFINLYTGAAYQSFQRDDKLKAMDYAMQGFSTDHPSPTGIGVLLSCIADQPPVDIISFINSLIDVNKPRDVQLITTQLMRPGYKEIYLFYLKRQVDTGIASTFDRLHFFFMAYGLVEFLTELQKVAEAAQTQADMAPVIEHLFLATICLGDKNIYLNNKELLTGMEHIIEAYFNGTVLEAPTEEDIRILNICYGHIVFTSGMETADRFRGIYSTAPEACFSIKAHYCLNSFEFDELSKISLAGVGENDWNPRSPVIFSKIMAEKHDEALSMIKHFLSIEEINEDLLNLISLLAFKSDDPIKSEAQALYDKYIPVLDEIIDHGDVARTGLLIVKDKNSQSKAVRNLKPKELGSMIEESKALFTPNKLLDILTDAAPVYIDKKAPLIALKCYVRLIAHDRDKNANIERAKELFTREGNSHLAEHLENYI